MHAGIALILKYSFLEMPLSLLVNLNLINLLERTECYIAIAFINKCAIPCHLAVAEIKIYTLADGAVV
jgi:hypothetical protein